MPLHAIVDARRNRGTYQKLRLESRIHRPPKAVALPRALQSFAKSAAGCAAIHGHPRRSLFSTRHPHPLRRRICPSRTSSLLFPSETHLKTCGKTAAKLRMEKMCKTCGKSADFLRITPRKSVQKPVDNLRGSGGKPAENASPPSGLKL